jgi:hypothetical protein
MAKQRALDASTLIKVTLVAFLGITVALLCFAYALQWLYNADRRKVASMPGNDDGSGGGNGGNAEENLSQKAKSIEDGRGGGVGPGGGGGLKNSNWRRLQIRSTRRGDPYDLDTKFLESYV